MRNISRIVFMLSVIRLTSSQLLAAGVNDNRKSLKSSQVWSNKSGLVEHFFNVIFNEFHSFPPLCVCVRMCADQPIYCYPNGCLKGEDANNKQAPHASRINENANPIFFLDDDTEFMDDFQDKNYVEENKVPAPVLTTTQEDSTISMRPDSLRDRYKILFKYKRMPKVELKYNVGEQVKNMKSDILKAENFDISKTRWPRNKINNHPFNVQRTFSDNKENSKFFVSMLLDKKVTNYTPKYFKRELTNDNKDDSVDVKAIYVVEKLPPINSTFSLESLIDSLIANSFQSNNTLNKVDQHNNIVMQKTIKETSSQITDVIDTMLNEYSTTESTITTQIFNNDTTNIISINQTNENVEKNKYIETNTKNNTKLYSKMIASLSRKIDMQNNTSLEMMKRLANNFDFHSTTTAIYKQGTNETTSQDTVTIITTENIFPSVDYNTRTTKKNKQRLARRLQKNKHN